MTRLSLALLAAASLALQTAPSPAYAGFAVLSTSSGIVRTNNFSTNPPTSIFTPSGPGATLSMNIPGAIAVESLVKFDLASVAAMFPGETIISLTLSGIYSGFRTNPGSPMPVGFLDSTLRAFGSSSPISTIADLSASQVAVGSIGGFSQSFPFTLVLSPAALPIANGNSALGLSIVPQLFSSGFATAIDLRLTVVTAAVPEPASLASVVVGLGMVAGRMAWARKRRTANQAA